MSELIELIERIKQRIEKSAVKVSTLRVPHVYMKAVGTNEIMRILDEESAKEPQEEPNIPIQCVDGSCPIALSEEYEECGMDVVHSCAECQYQPQVQQIVRTPEEIANMLNEKLECSGCILQKSCDKLLNERGQINCKTMWLDWILGKKVGE